MILVVNIGENDILDFGEILEIFIKQNSIYLLMKIINSTGFNDHYFTYNVSISRACILKNVSELPDIHPCLLIQKYNSLYVATKYIL